MISWGLFSFLIGLSLNAPPPACRRWWATLVFAHLRGGALCFAHTRHTFIAEVGCLGRGQHLCGPLRFVLPCLGNGCSKALGS